MEMPLLSKKKKNNVQQNIVASTQDHLDLLDIRDDYIVLKSGTVAAILETTAVNFYLLSEIEQESKIMAFAGLLNSLNFYIQVMIHTQRVDIGKYLVFLDEQKGIIKDENKKYQLELYRNFIKNLIQKNNVLDKKFYVVIPYTTSIKVTRTSFSMMIGKTQNHIDIDQAIKDAKPQLEPKKDVIMKLLGGMGVRSKQLKNNELTRLFYNLYNRDSAPITNIADM
jgi:hypothetical protein